MNAELQKLKDIHLPQAINNWPIAPGWIALFVILVSLLIYASYVWNKNRKKKYTVKFALSQLNALKTLMQDNPDDINIAAEISTLIRRTALHYFQREEIAGLSGNAWLEFLNRSAKIKKFSEVNGRLLTETPYQKISTTDLAPLFDYAQRWLIGISKKRGMLVEK